jgi:hypothetical protein
VHVSASHAQILLNFVVAVEIGALQCSSNSVQSLMLVSIMIYEESLIIQIFAAAP